MKGLTAISSVKKRAAVTQRGGTEVSPGGVAVGQVGEEGWEGG